MSHEPHPTIEVKTFGNLRLSRDGIELEELPGRLALIFSTLIASGGETVGVHELVDLLWETDPPASAVNQVHRHVGELRRVLEPQLATRAAGTVVESRHDGYRLRPGSIAVDLHEFDSLIQSAARADARGDLVEQLDLLVDAFEVASGPPFSDVSPASSAPAAFASIDTRRLDSAVRLADVALQLKTPARALPILQGIAAEAPLNEVLQAHLIRLFTAEGRAAEGLAHFAATAELLRTQLGVDPGPALRSAHLEAVSTSEPPASHVSPHWVSALPTANSSWVDPPGIGSKLANLSEEFGETGGITVISGGGGIGKTTLAVHWARAVQEQLEVGALYVDLLGFHPELDPLPAVTAAGTLLTQLGIEHEKLSPAATFDLLGAASRRNRLIVVLDNARDAEQLRPLLGSLDGCFTIVTTRTLLPTLMMREGARLVRLDRWDAEASRALIRKRLGLTASSVDSVDSAIDSIVEACSGLPLALVIAAARTFTVQAGALESVAREFASTRGSIEAFTIPGEIDDLRSAFASSYRALDDDARVLFRTGSMVPESAANLRALAAAAGLDLGRAEIAVRNLLVANMLRETGSGTYATHDLVRSYALDLLATTERDAADSRLISYATHSLRALWLLTGRHPLFAASTPRVPEAVIENFAGYGEARAWAVARITTGWLDGLMRIARNLGLPRDAITMRLDLRPVLDDVRPVAESLADYTDLAEVAVTLDDVVLIAELRRMEAYWHAEQRHPEIADPLLESCLELFGSVGNDLGMALTYRTMANGATRRRLIEPALEFAERALVFAKASGDQSMVASCGIAFLNVLGEAEQFDRLVEAAPGVIADCRRWSPIESFKALERLSFSYVCLGRFEEALVAARESLQFSDRGQPADVIALSNMWVAAARLGNRTEYDAAVRDYRDLLARFEDQFESFLGAREWANIQERFAYAAGVMAGIEPGSGFPRG